MPPRTGRLTAVADQDSVEGTADVRRAFAATFASGLAELTDDDLTGGKLTLPLGVSAWMQQEDVEIGEARAAMFALRSAILETSSLDSDSEPIPLLARDPITSLLSLATYLHCLVARAAAHAATTRLSVVERALPAVNTRLRTSVG
ncbi:MAG TPA: hypothetical protein VEJ87_15455 [Acidimicrobiales bacterium]|nr:hypothetical protein [Acidimicrobiales bacterium]